MNDTIEPARLADDDSALQPEFLKSIENALDAGDAKRIRALVADLHAADLADLMELLSSEARSRLLAELGSDLNFEALSELDETVRDQVIEELPNEQLAEAVRELDTDDAVYLLEDLEAAEQSDILSKLPPSERSQLQRSLDYPEDSAGRLMQSEFIAVPPFWSVGQTIDYMRETEDLPNTFGQLFVVDPTFHLLGAVRLDRLLRTKRPVLIQDVMETEVRAIAAELDQEEVARQFERYDLYEAPVVDENDRLVGIVTVDDVVEVIQEEAEEDIKRLGGVVGDESLSDSVWRISQRRFAWLLVNLAAACISASVIALFDATIAQMVALAVLMPMVASMGGNAGTQTMTVAVRALATKELGPLNAQRIITREAIVGLVNGIVFAFLLAGVAIVWFESAKLGLVIATAMLVNMLVAGLFGVLIPITLDRFNIDPAIASSVFLTTMTDVVGFFAFLGLATLWLL